MSTKLVNENVACSTWNKDCGSLTFYAILFVIGREGEMEAFLQLPRTPIEAGWSTDQKYCVTARSGERFLLRISPIEKFEKRQNTFSMLQLLAKKGWAVSRPLACGACEEGAYLLLSWVEGEPAEKVLARSTQEEQYRLGRSAGTLLKAIHALPAPADAEPWQPRFGRKLDRNIRLYEDCPVKPQDGEALIAYINENRGLLNGRPQCYQHGDFHVGNFLIGADGALSAIDFDRDDHGDPWEEFNRLVWSAQCAPPFACGQIDAYFADAIPPNFWRLMALYMASNALSSTPWALPFGKEQTEIMLRQVKELVTWFDGMREPVPRWYRDNAFHGK